MEYKINRTNPLFGISGLSHDFYEVGNKHTYQMPKWITQVGLEAFEYSFGRGVNIGLETCQKIGEECAKYNIAISGHAPYFVNYTNPDEEKINASHKYILDSCIAIKNMHGNRVVVHVGVQGKELSREESVKKVKSNLYDLIQKLDENDLQDSILCLETMGKYSQIGNHKEIADLCSIDTRFIPCFDFGHMNCLAQGGLKHKQDFKDILNYCIDKLGIDKIKNCHVHFSKIKFGKAGELKHINFDDDIYGPEFEPFCECIVELNLTPTIINESEITRTEDALFMKNRYYSYST